MFAVVALRVHLRNAATMLMVTAMQPKRAGPDVSGGSTSRRTGAAILPITVLAGPRYYLCVVIWVSLIFVFDAAIITWNLTVRK